MKKQQPLITYYNLLVVGTVCLDLIHQEGLSTPSLINWTLSYSQYTNWQPPKMISLCSSSKKCNFEEMWMACIFQTLTENHLVEYLCEVWRMHGLVDTWILCSRYGKGLTKPIRFYNVNSKTGGTSCKSHQFATACRSPYLGNCNWRAVWWRRTYWLIFWKEASLKESKGMNGSTVVCKRWRIMGRIYYS